MHYKCAICGEELQIELTINDVVILYPCAKCLAKEFMNGYDEGLYDGMYK